LASTRGDRQSPQDTAHASKHGIAGWGGQGGKQAHRHRPWSQSITPSNLLSIKMSANRLDDHRLWSAPAPCRSFRLSLPCAFTFGGQQDSVAVPKKDVRFQCGFGVIGTLAERKRSEVRAVSMALGALGQGGVHPLALRVRTVSVMRRIPFRRHRIELDFV